MLELYLRVTGRVQGVGFRATARQFAGQLGLMGYAANLPDGSVEICAQGEREHLEKFPTRLQTEFAGYIGEIPPCRR